MSELGSGGFLLPKMFHRDQQAVIDSLKMGNVDFADISQWSFADEFFGFAIQSGFLKFADSTYPNPREKNEVPIWFLLGCQFIMKLYHANKYHQLGYLLNAGSIVSRVGFNISSPVKIGFNNKNLNDRKTAADPDTVRKFFKDTSSIDLRSWFNRDIQGWFKSKQAFQKRGLFVLDQTHVVVPSNKNYINAVKMPVDEHGQWYELQGLTAEQKKVLPYHPCYTLSTLLNVGTQADHFHIAGYDWGPGNQDELPQAEQILKVFCDNNPGVIKELIVDRGYMDGDFISQTHKDYGIDLLVPLRKNMTTYQEALDIAKRNNSWTIMEQEKSSANGNLLREFKVAQVNDLDVWLSCKIPQHSTVGLEKIWDEESKAYKERPWVLVSTQKYAKPELAIERYRLRVQIEERYRQLKHSWNIAKFPSPNGSLIETQVVFTLLTYSLIQLYLRREDLHTEAGKFCQTLRQAEKLGKEAVLVYHGDQFAVLNLSDYSMILLDLEPAAQAKMKELFKAQRK